MLAAIRRRRLNGSGSLAMFAALRRTVSVEIAARPHPHAKQ
jgi:hypothetical protein